MTRAVVEGILATNVAPAGTFTVSYPPGKTRGDFSIGTDHRLVVNGAVAYQPTDMGLSFGASSVTVTNRTGGTWHAGDRFLFQFDEPGGDPVSSHNKRCYVPIGAQLLNLGSPAAIVTTGICESQNVGAAGPLTLNGALVVGGVAVLDVPRNVIVDSGGADDAVLTITGTDVYGKTMVETITMNGTTAVAGKKAFKTVTSIAASKAIANGGFVGTGDVLGLPVRVPAAGFILKELEDGAAASAGTVVGGLSRDTKATATNADVRGTYDPSSACDGSKAFALIVALPNPDDLGNPQYTA